MELKAPSPTTLRRYGLSLEEWNEIADRQNRVCAVCHKLPGKRGILNIDHHHVRGWAKMEPEQRKRYVRGLLCYTDNSVFLRKGASPERLRSAAEYLERYLTTAP